MQLAIQYLVAARKDKKLYAEDGECQIQTQSTKEYEKN